MCHRGQGVRHGQAGHWVAGERWQCGMGALTVGMAVAGTVHGTGWEYVATGPVGRHFPRPGRFGGIWPSPLPPTRAVGTHPYQTATPRPLPYARPPEHRTLPPHNPPTQKLNTSMPPTQPPRTPAIQWVVPVLTARALVDCLGVRGGALQSRRPSLWLRGCP